MVVDPPGPRRGRFGSVNRGRGLTDGVWWDVVLAAGLVGAIVYPLAFGIGSLDEPVAAVAAIQVALAVVPAVFLLLVEKRLGKTLATVPLVLLLAFLAWTALAALQSPDRANVVRAIWFIAAAVNAAWHVRARGWARTLDVVGWVLLPYTVISLALTAPLDLTRESTEFWDETFFPWPRVTGLAVSANVFGLIAAHLAVIAVARRRAWGWLAWVAIAVGVVGMLTSQTRTAAIVAVVGVAILLAPESRRGRQRMGAMALAGAVLVGAVVVITGATQYSDLLTRGNENEAAVSVAGRSEAWEPAIEWWQERPLSGHGLGAAEGYYDELYDEGYLVWDPNHAHNVLLDVLVHSGVVGAVVFVGALAGYLVVRRRRIVSRSADAFVFSTLAYGLVESVFIGFPAQDLVLLAAAFAHVGLAAPRPALVDPAAGDSVLALDPGPALSPT